MFVWPNTLCMWSEFSFIICAFFTNCLCMSLTNYIERREGQERKLYLTKNAASGPSSTGCCTPTCFQFISGPLAWITLGSWLSERYRGNWFITVCKSLKDLNRRVMEKLKHSEKKQRKCSVILEIDLLSGFSCDPPHRWIWRNTAQYLTSGTESQHRDCTLSSNNQHAKPHRAIQKSVP